jgi:hypothetical protein
MYNIEYTTKKENSYERYLQREKQKELSNLFKNNVKDPSIIPITNAPTTSLSNSPRTPSPLHKIWPPYPNTPYVYQSQTNTTTPQSPGFYTDDLPALEPVNSLSQTFQSEILHTVYCAASATETEPVIEAVHIVEPENFMSKYFNL